MEDIICHEVVSIDCSGITLKAFPNDIYISFYDCAKNYATEKNLDISKCVATRDISTLSFTFYTLPKTRIVFKRNFLMDHFWGKSALHKFWDLQKAIVKYGYTSFDLS